MENKHAYLIIAHNEFEVLKILLELLDDKRHDFYINIDKKATDFDINSLYGVINKSEIHVINRMNVTWGGDSLIKCELSLLYEAFKAHNNYSFYHFLSGVDLPIKKRMLYMSFMRNIENIILLIMMKKL